MTDAPKEMPQTVWLDKFDGCQTWAFSRNYFGEGGGPTDEMEVTEYYRADLTPSVKPLEWQPIETAPKDGTRFWAYEKGAGPDCYECWWQNDFGHWEGWQTDWDNEPDPTHWRPAITPDGPSDHPTPSDKDKEIERLREALTEIERIYYNEGEGMKRRAARMRALASAALEERG